jgi:ankyrin repeat protein
LAAGSKVIKSEESKNKSLLLKAVENSRFDIAELVLSYGALTDDQDSLNGFANSVMVTCQTKNFEMLELLIKYGADLNIASQIERKDKKNRAYKVMIHPIFIASTLDKRFLEVSSSGFRSITEDIVLKPV